MVDQDARRKTYQRMNKAELVEAVMTSGQAEEDMAEKEAQLRVALDNMPGGMMFCDRDLNYVLFNAQYRELHDYDGVDASRRGYPRFEDNLIAYEYDA